MCWIWKCITTQLRIGTTNGFRSIFGNHRRKVINHVMCQIQFFGVLQSLICSKKGKEGRNAQKSGTCQERIVRKEKLGSFIKVSVVVVPTNQDSAGLSPKGSAKQHEKQLTNTTKTFGLTVVSEQLSALFKGIFACLKVFIAYFSWYKVIFLRISILHILCYWEHL